MLLTVALTVILATSCLADGRSKRALTEKNRAISSRNNDFNYDIFEGAVVASEGGNVFISPLSISTALALVYLGAKGDTRKELENALGFTSEDALDSYRATLRHLNDMSDEGDVTLRVANRIFADKSLKIEDSYQQQAEEYFEAPVERLTVTGDEKNAVDVINSWVEDKTEERIKDLLQPTDLQDVLMVLVNAVYFNAYWKHVFPNRKTHDAKFHVTPSKSVDANFMTITEQFRLGDFNSGGVKAKILELEYKGNDVAMYVILPEEGYDLCDVQRALDSQSVSQAIQSLKLQSHVQVYLPKFENEYRTLLKPVLEDLGLTTIFSGAADLSGMSPVPLKVDQVIHKAFVKVNENGTEAAAATAVTIVRTSLPLVQHTFKIDRPFMFIIREKESDVDLFVGRIVNPDGDKDLTKGEKLGCSRRPQLRRVVAVVAKDGGGVSCILPGLFIYPALLLLNSLLSH